MMRGLLGARTHTARSGRRSCRPLAQSLIEAGFDRVDSCFVGGTLARLLTAVLS